jgi:hypothetical protein
LLKFIGLFAQSEGIDPMRDFSVPTIGGDTGKFVKATIPFL